MQTWTGTGWLNPPYGKTIGLWFSKAREAALAGATVVALIPARTDTKRWHGIVTAAEMLKKKCINNAEFIDAPPWLSGS